MVSAIAIGMMAISVTGAVLSYYGKITVTATVGQSVVVGSKEFSADGIVWHNYDEPITREIGTTDNPMVHCTNYCYKNWIWNRACEDALVSFPINWIQAPNGDSTGFEVNQFVFGETQTIDLIQKVVDYDNSPWYAVGDPDYDPKGVPTMSATVTFNTCGPCLVGSIDYKGLTPNIVYDLVYYKDINPRWNGTGTVTILCEFTSDSDGIGTEQINNCAISTIPAKDDYNAGPDINYGTTGTNPTGDNYEHINGAKFWLLPTAMIDGNKITWGTEDVMQEAVLWETDLGFYMDCDILNPEPLPNVWSLFSLIHNDVATIKSGQTYCWITCNHVVMNIVEGIYVYEQKLAPVSI
jgi:hypothetical protein